MKTTIMFFSGRAPRSALSAILSGSENGVHRREILGEQPEIPA